MYIAEGSGLEVYETFDELISKGVRYVWDYQNNYYILVEKEDNYDNRIWIVDKKTHEISTMFFTEFFDLMDEAMPIDPKIMKRGS